MALRPTPAAVVRTFGLTFGLTLALGGCDGGSVVGTSSLTTAPLVCSDVDVDGGVSACASGPTYATVQPIFQKACVPCHFESPDPDAPWPLTSYASIAAWDSVVLDDLRDCSMPPADGGVPYSEHDRDTLVKWLACKHPM